MKLYHIVNHNDDVGEIFGPLEVDMSDPGGYVLVSMQDLAPAANPSDSDTFAICQNPGGCGPNDSLLRVRMDDIAAYVLSKAPVVPLPQYASLIVPYANRVPLTTDVGSNIAQVNLPVGDWLIFGEFWYVVDAGTPTLARAAVALTQNSALIPTDPSDAYSVSIREPQQPKQAGAQAGVMPLAPLHIMVETPTTYYLAALLSWSGGGSIAGYGKIAGWMHDLSASRQLPSRSE